MQPPTPPTRDKNAWPAVIMLLGVLWFTYKVLELTTR